MGFFGTDDSDGVMCEEFIAVSKLVLFSSLGLICSTSSFKMLESYSWPLSIDSLDVVSTVLRTKHGLIFSS